jgi:hypothetical protein
MIPEGGEDEGRFKGRPELPKRQGQWKSPLHLRQHTTETATTSSRGLAWSASKFLLIGYADNLAPDRMDQLRCPCF